MFAFLRRMKSIKKTTCKRLSSCKLHLEILEDRTLLATSVFFANFDAPPTVLPGITAQFSGITTTQSVQGYGTLGANNFSGNMLRNATGQHYGPGSPTFLTLTNLPAHTSIDVKFRVAIIDSWDGVAPQQQYEGANDRFHVLVDGSSLLSEIFDNAGAGGVQTYVPPPGVTLARRINLGFTASQSFFVDSAYNMGLDPRFVGIPHTSSTLTIQWFADGPGWGGDNDESWGMDNVEILLNGVSDIDMQSAQLVSGRTVQYTYATTGNPGPFQVGIYQSADGTTFDPLLPIATQPVTPSPTNPQTPGTFTLPTSLVSDGTKPFIVVVADPPSAVKPKGDILESNDTDFPNFPNNNNVQSLRLPDIALTPTSLSFDTAQGGVNFQYMVTGAPLPQDAAAFLLLGERAD